jgi:F-type H+-transporting ATPase subunit delta
MSDTRAAYRYARALLGTAVERKLLDAIGEDFELIEKTARSSREFLAFLRSPVINMEKKKSVLTAAFQKRVHPLTFQFLMLIASRNRESILPEIIRQFERLRDEELGVENAIVRTAVPLSREHEKQLSTKLERLRKKKIRLQHILDPSLKGGIQVQVGDTVWDGSIKHQLELLRQRFAGSHA